VTRFAAGRLARGLFGTSVLLVLSAGGLTLLGDPFAAVSVLVLGLAVAGYGVVGMLVARRRPRNPIGWLFSAVALGIATWVFGLSYADFRSPPGDAFGTLPGSAAVAWVAILAPVAALPAALPAFLLVFPDGRLRSRRWRVPLLGAAASPLLIVVGFAATIDRWSGSFPLEAPGWILRIPAVRGFAAGGLLLATAAGFAGLLSLVLRFRSAAGPEREQLRLLVVMLAAMGIATPLALPLGWAGVFLTFIVDGFGILIGIPLATAAAVLTFGLYDVGFVVKKTIVYGLLVALFLLVLVPFLLLLSPAALGGTAGEEDVAARVVGTLVASALVLATAWRPAKRIARRLVYGKRSTPYEAMAEFSERLGETYSTDDVLPRMAEIVRASTSADVARVWLRVGTHLRPAAAAPPGAAAAGSLEMSGDELPEIPEVRAFPVRHRGELLGALTVQMPRAEPLSKTGEKLVSDLAAQAGLVLRNVRLIEELQESRRRIVAAQDERARKLERDIHDGAQQQLVALTVKLGLLEQLAARDPSKAKEVAIELRAEASDALENLRDLARGIYPPLLADRGLVAALEAQATKALLPVAVEAHGVGRYPQEVEAAAYFCCLEALQNVAKYANATSATVGLRDGAGELIFEVADDGVGFEPSSATHGSGLTNMRDRLEALGGRLEIASRPAGGTTVAGRIPVGGGP
jgi:signal transduction histidine kinase